ncbi:Tudor domain-containing protein 3 [Linum grandiflorum]
MEGESSRSTNITDDVIQTLTTRGWCFGDLDRVKAIAFIQSGLSDDGKPSTIANSVESELLNMDIRSFGGKSLPEPGLLSKSSHFQGRKVLQICSVRDIALSTIDAFSSSGHRRLLKLVLTDGHTEIPAIEYSHLSTIPSDVAPGYKILVENKAPIHSGILCLNPKMVTPIGGVVQSLHEEWLMNRKYAVFSRSSMRPTQEGDVAGPPAFEKLQTGVTFTRPSSSNRVYDYFQAISKSSMPVAEELVHKGDVRLVDAQNKAGNIVDNPKTVSTEENARWKPLRSAMRPKEENFASTSRFTSPSAAENVQNNANITSTSGSMKTTALAESKEEKTSNSYSRPKEVAESVPVQNQAAAQKLLQKMAPPNQYRGRGRRQQRGRGRNEYDSEPQTWTLEEWQNRNNGANKFPDTSNDEDFAWQLQNQLAMEDSHAQRGTQGTVATDIRISMFSFDRDGDTSHDMEHVGRGRGRSHG